MWKPFISSQQDRIWNNQRLAIGFFCNFVASGGNKKTKLLIGLVVFNKFGKFLSFLHIIFIFNWIFFTWEADVPTAGSWLGQGKLDAKNKI